MFALWRNFLEQGKLLKLSFNSSCFASEEAVGVKQTSSYFFFFLFYLLSLVPFCERIALEK
jgi:hypothetical protein